MKEVQGEILYFIWWSFQSVRCGSMSHCWRYEVFRFVNVIDKVVLDCFWSIKKSQLILISTVGWCLWNLLRMKLYTSSEVFRLLKQWSHQNHLELRQRIQENHLIPHTTQIFNNFMKPVSNSWIGWFVACFTVKAYKVTVWADKETTQNRATILVWFPDSVLVLDGVISLGILIVE